jgi:hypothetical protein
MSRTYNFAYTVSKEHPYITDGFSAAEAFEALRRAAAEKPLEVFNMAESGMLYKDQTSKNSYWIRMQE